MRGTEGHEDDFPKKKRSMERGEIWLLCISLPRTCPKSLLFLSPSQDEEEGLPLLLANAPPLQGPICLFTWVHSC